MINMIVDLDNYIAKVADSSSRERHSPTEGLEHSRDFQMS